MVIIKLKELQQITGNYPAVLISSFGKPFYSHDVLNRRFKELLKERSLYNLRHTFASHMISNIHNGIDILWVSKMLGHKDVSITLKVYVKFVKEDEKTRLNKLNLISKNLELSY